MDKLPAFVLMFQHSFIFFFMRRHVLRRVLSDSLVRLRKNVNKKLALILIEC